jgi:hypothetical protein
MRKESFLQLIAFLSDYFTKSSNKEKIELFIDRAKNENPWFSEHLILEAMEAVHLQFFDIKSALMIKPQTYKNNKLSQELKISQFDKEHVRVVALLDKKSKLVAKLSGKSITIQSESKAAQPKQTPKEEAKPQKEESSKSVLNELNLELEKTPAKQRRREQKERRTLDQAPREPPPPKTHRSPPASAGFS